MADKRLNIKIRTDGAKKAKGALGGVDNKMKSLAKSAMAAGAAFFAAQGLIRGFKAVIRLAGEQEQAEKRLEVALGKTSTALLNQATALQQMTTFGDEAIIGVQASIAAFVDSEEQIKLATEATLDMAVAMGMDLKGAGDLIAKTLGSSTNALSRYGITVEGAVGSTERLESLTQNVAKLFGGQAKAQAETMAGSLQQMENAVGDAGEAIGTLLSPVVIDLAKDVKGLAEWWGKWLHEVENTKPATAAESDQTKKLSEEIQELNTEINYRLNLLRNENLLRIRAKDQNNTIIEQKNKEKLAIANLNAEIKKLSETKKYTEELEKASIDDSVKKAEKIKTEIELTGQLVDKEQGLAIIKKEGSEAELKSKIEKQKLVVQELKQAALVQGSAKDAMKAVVRAETMEAIAGYISSVLKSVPFPANLILAAGGGALVSGLIDKGLSSFAQGGDFVTSGPQMIAVGDNPGGRERVQVTPLSSPNIDGPQGGITVNISGGIIQDDYVRNELIPAINKAKALA
jgi:hypothetical protein